ncbi:MAG: helix-turn-helix domain-containing protein [Pseudomonadota bacterium]
MFGHPSRSIATSSFPGMTYPHLTQDERYQIATDAKAGHDQSAIAPVMNRHKSTISRALRRNRGRLAEQGLTPFKTAQAVSDAMISMPDAFRRLYSHADNRQWQGAHPPRGKRFTSTD